MTRFWITLEQGVNFVLARLEDMRGGEIFVPKIPSMKLLDLAEALAPECQKKIVGIRPGEKLHEVMVPEDDAHHTWEYDQFFAIVPAFHEWTALDNLQRPGGRPCPDGFRYSSDTNPQWLTIQDLRAMIGHNVETAHA